MTPPDSSDRAWALLFHEDTLFHQRLEIFLVAHTLLIAPFGFALSRTDPPHAFLIGLASVGALLGLAWAVVQVRSKTTIQNLEALVEHDEVYQKAYRHVVGGTGRRILSQTGLMAVGLPSVVTAGWVTLALLIWLGVL